MRGIHFLFVGLVVSACGSAFHSANPGKDAGRDSSGGSAGTAGATGGTSGTGGSTGGTAGKGGTAGTAGSAGASGGGGGGGCTAQCQSGFTCCGGTCVTENNDINNCGACGHKCTGTHPYCNNGTCGSPPCTVGGVTRTQVVF